MPVLTLLDAMRIQSFVFASNRLQDVAGGSLLVEWALGQWVQEAAHPNQGQVIMSAGGNALVRFFHLDAAQAFAAAYSRRLLEEAPGLEVAIVHTEYEPGHLAEGLQHAYRKMQRHKAALSPHTPLLGLSVTERCRETRRSAVTLRRDDDNLVPIAATVRARRDAMASNQGRDRWRDLFPQKRPAFLGTNLHLDFPTRLDWVVPDSGFSLMGIVHVDGNGVGRRIQEWLQGAVDRKLTDEQVERQMQEWSNSLSSHGRKALEQIVLRMVEALAPAEGQPGEYVLRLRHNRGEVPLHTENNTVYLPFRPILLGGDDLTFVCNGRLALELAETALGVLSNQSVPHLMSKLHAAAGVAFIRFKAPFSRGYALSASLCANVKRWLREEELDTSALDWHVARTALVDDLRAFREREFAVGGYRLTMRPYPLEPSVNHKGWSWLANTVLGADAETSGFRSWDWVRRRHKVKELAEAARQGPGGVERKLSVWRQSAPDLQLPSGMREGNGFTGDATALLDAAELLDLYLPLERGAADHG